MVAVESYVKVHYGRGTGTGHAARAAPLSNDFELALMTSPPTEEWPRRPPPARAPPPPPAPSLHALAAPTRPSRLSPLITLSQTQRDLSKISSDYTVDIFSDKEIVTAVASPGQKQQTQLTNQIQQTQLHQQTRQTQHSPGTYNSIAELELLENALYRKMSQGSFPKRLRIKNLTLTPKHSTQRIMVLQSGDSTSLVLKSKLSKIKINSSKSASNEIGYQTLSTTHVDWRFTQMPVQISTVGYAFPSYENKSGCNMISQKNAYTDALLTEKMYNESNAECGSPEVEMTCHYFKSSRAQPGSECAVQVTNTDFSAPAARLQVEATTSTTSHPNNRLLVETGITTQLVDPDVIPMEQSESQNSNQDDKEGSAFIDYTSSLDILVGLLNEIQKITSCSCNELGDGNDANKLNPAHSETLPVQTTPSETTPSETTPASKLEKTAPVQILGTTASTSVNTLRKNELDITTYGTTLFTTLDETELATELKKAAPPVNNPDEAADMTAQVGTPDEAAQDSRDYKLSKKDSVPLQDPVSNSNLITLYEPKNAVNSDVMVKTEINSVMPKCVDKGVGVARLAPGPAALASPSSSRSVFYSRPEIETSKIRLREIGTNPGTVKSLVLFHDNVVKNVKKVSVTCRSFMKKAEGRKEKPSNNLVDTVDPEEGGQAKTSQNKCLNAAVSDPMVRVKRDILVTVYSLLVLTVFAALSLPEMLLHQA